MQIPNLQVELAPEWLIVQQAAADQLSDIDVIGAFKPCRTLEIFTDGSAPISNPGGPAGFAVVAVGYRELIDASTEDRPQPCARIGLADYIPARTAEPQTSNNRAEIAGVLAAFELIRRLGESAANPGHVYIWSDSKYAVSCGNGIWQRKKNTDLWASYDEVLDAAGRAISGTVELSWVKGHAGNQHNDAADEAATRAAFNFDEVAYKRFRAAQTATGREMPGTVALSQHGVKLETRMIDTPTSRSTLDKDGMQMEATGTDEWQVNTDYALLLLTHLNADRPNAGSGLCMGIYRLVTNKGRSYQTKVKHTGEHILVEGEYLTLLSALDDLSKRIKAAERGLHNFTLTIFSGQELVTKQLTGAYQVKSQLLKPLYEQAQRSLAQFERVEIVWKPNALLKKELR